MDDLTTQIGEAAGAIYRILEGATSGTTLTEVRSQTEIPNDVLQRAVGWLAREGKIHLEASGKVLRIMLK